MKSGTSTRVCKGKKEVEEKGWCDFGASQVVLCFIFLREIIGDPSALAQFGPIWLGNWDYY
jgi:hypothetical protein